MKIGLRSRFRDMLGNMKLSRKIQLSLMLIIIPLFIIFVLLFLGMYGANRQYNQIIANATEAGRFSIKFKEEFDYKIYLLIAGHSSFSEENPYASIDEAKEIVLDLINNTKILENKRRAEIIMKLLGNLEKYVRRIEENKKEGGHYDENFTIWENDVQLVTGLIQSTILEYIYYETRGMEEIRVKVAEDLSKMILFCLGVFVFLTIVALFLSFVIPNSIVKPIHHLNDITNQVARGNLKVRANALQGAEVKSLGNSLNIMIEKIEHLLEAVKEDETNLRVAELELLQAQINPHFLYNTLDTIIWLAEAGKQDEVVEMVTYLSDFFRTSLNHGTGMATLREEERHLRSYLQIQHMRYQDILEYEIDIPDNLKEAIIPKITLQPIVENALYHGIKNRRGKGRIVVSATNADSDVIISIMDNGIGMTPERLNEVINFFSQTDKQVDKDQKRDSYGLYNVNQRLKLKFGDSYGLSISSEYGKGTCVKVKIPFKG
ncbi:MAG: sensor histidine kinase [Clostridiaceae bacterium]|nr:sensor histidine kinase [Clostridiaceae bacterium]